MRSGFGKLNVLRSRAFFPVHNFELDALTLFQALVARTLNGAVMDEHVLGALTRDEPIALCVVEPLDGSNGRVDSLGRVCYNYIKKI